jgi:L-ascorbate metabolism protein UlaG (beta-lactamase superfamily)
VTHEHYDHFSPEDIEKLKKEDPVLVIPKTVKPMLGELLSPCETKLVSVGETFQVKGIDFEAVAAYNVGKQFHTKDKEWIGYLMRAGGTSYYVAGDTDRNEDNGQVTCDVALIPIGGTYTMDAAAAAAFVNHLHPKAAIPTHYGNIVGSKTDADAFASLVDKDISVIPKIKQFKQ